MSFHYVRHILCNHPHREKHRLVGNNLHVIYCSQWILTVLHFCGHSYCIFGGSLSLIRVCNAQIAQRRQQPAHSRHLCRFGGICRPSRRHKMTIQRSSPSYLPCNSAGNMQFLQQLQHLLHWIAQPLQTVELILSSCPVLICHPCISRSRIRTNLVFCV